MPHDSTTDDASDGELPIADDEEGFLDDLPAEDYPSTLRITSNPERVHREDALDRARRLEAGEAVPHVVNFQDPSDLRALLTDRRVELLRSVMTDRPDSIRGLAERLGRDVKSVHDDLQVLAEYDVVRFQRNGRAKRPFVPHDTIEVALEITSTVRTLHGCRSGVPGEPPASEDHRYASHPRGAPRDRRGAPARASQRTPSRQITYLFTRKILYSVGPTVPRHDRPGRGRHAARAG